MHPRTIRRDTRKRQEREAEGKETDNNYVTMITYQRRRRDKGTFGPIKGRKDAEITVDTFASFCFFSTIPYVFAPRGVDDSHTVGRPTCRHPMVILIRPTSAHPVKNNILCKWAIRALRKVSFLSSSLFLPLSSFSSIFPFSRR